MGKQDLELLMSKQKKKKDGGLIESCESLPVAAIRKAFVKYNLKG
jgi:hypothetical protein